MQSGYCMDISDRTFADFFADVLNINIDEERYYAEGGSKGKRMCYFLRSQPDHVIGRLLHSLWEHRMASVHYRDADLR